MKRSMRADLARETVEIVERTILVLVRRGDRRERDAVRELGLI